MNKVKMVGFAVVAMVALGIMSSSALAASPEFLDNGATIAAGSKLAADSEGKVVLSDLAAGVTVECSGKDEGEITGEKTATEKVVTATACTTLKGSCSSPLATAAKLPWTFELGAGVKLNALKETGWEVVCSGIIKDTCTSAAGKPQLAFSTGTDPLVFKWEKTANEGIGNCSLGGTGQGDVEGEVQILFTAAGELIAIN